MKKILTVFLTVVICITMIFTVAYCESSDSSANKSASGSETENSKTESSKTKDSKTEDSAGKKVYFAAPLFSQMEKDYNLKLTKVLEDHGYEVFLPQRDGYLAADLKGKSEEEKTEMIFEKDVQEILNADILFMLLDGRVPDEGACVELGIAYANNKRCYGAKTDVRSTQKDMDINPLITGCFTELFDNSDGDEMIEELEQYLSENEL